MRGGGVALKSLSLVFRTIEFCCAAVILALFSYFLANLHDHNRVIPTRNKAITGIAGAGVLYTIFAFIFVCCLGSISFFSYLAMLLDLAFAGAFIYVAWAARGGVQSASSTGIICTPLGCGNQRTNVVSSSIRYITAHRMETAVFAVAIIAIILFFLNIFVNLGLARHRKKEKAFGPSPNNGYTAGSPKRKFWQRKRKTDTEMVGGLGAKKVHPDALPPHASPADVRPSYATDSTAVEPVSKYEHTSPVGGQQTGYAAADRHAPYAQTQGYAPGSAQMPAGNYHATSNANGTF